MPKITVYTTANCSYCTRLKRLLDARGLPYEEVDLARDIDARIGLAKSTGMMTFPQVLIDGALLGGFAETEAALRDGHLEELLTV